MAAGWEVKPHAGSEREAKVAMAEDGVPVGLVGTYCCLICPSSTEQINISSEKGVAWSTLGWGVAGTQLKRSEQDP